MVKITPNAPSCDHAKKIVFQRLCFLKTEYSSKESIFLTIRAILCLFSDSLLFQWKMLSF